MEKVKMNKAVISAKEEISKFFEKEFGKDLMFVIIYGSCAFGINGKCSDIDLVAVCRRYSQKQLNETIAFVKDLHKRYGLHLDEEVPYETKLLAKEEFVKKAIWGDGFEKRGRIIIPQVIKSREFLSSERIALRLMLNALATKTIFCCGDEKCYDFIRKEALKNYVRIFYSAWQTESMSVEEFADSLIKKEGREGQFYLGFENLPLVKTFLIKEFKETFKDLGKEGRVKKIKNKYQILDEEWFKEINQIS